MNLLSFTIALSTCLSVQASVDMYNNGNDLYSLEKGSSSKFTNIDDVQVNDFDTMARVYSQPNFKGHTKNIRIGEATPFIVKSFIIEDNDFSENILPIKELAITTKDQCIDVGILYYSHPAKSEDAYTGISILDKNETYKKLCPKDGEFKITSMLHSRYNNNILGKTISVSLKGTDTNKIDSSLRFKIPSDTTYPYRFRRDQSGKFNVEIINKDLTQIVIR